MQTKEITLIAIFTAILCILAPFIIPVGVVPVSLATGFIYVYVLVLGLKKSLLCCGLYILIGVIGFPVFSGFTGGIAKIAGPTGGYILGYLVIILVAGGMLHGNRKSKVLSFFALLTGTIFCYILGTIWLAWQTQVSFEKAVLIGVLPFVIPDLVKIIIAMWIGRKMVKLWHFSE